MNKQLILFGDSLVSGYGIPKKHSFAHMLSDFLPIDVFNYGINGDSTVNMLFRFYEDVICKKPDYIFIMGGTNDLLLGRHLTSIIDNIEELILDSLKITSNIYIGIPPTIKKEMAQNLFMSSPFYDYCHKNLPVFKTLLIELCSKYDIPYMDFYSITLKNYKNNIFSDGIHLNSFGNILLFKEFTRIFDLSN